MQDFIQQPHPVDLAGFDGLFGKAREIALEVHLLPNQDARRAEVCQ